MAPHQWPYKRLERMEELLEELEERVNELEQINDDRIDDKKNKQFYEDKLGL
jgi:hypothetical protein